MNSDYKNLAYERTVITALRRFLEEKYLEGGGGVKEELICEALPHEDRQVPSTAFIEVILRLQAEEKRLSEDLSQFSFRREAVRPLAPKPAAQPPDGAKAGKSRAKPASTD